MVFAMRAPRSSNGPKAELLRFAAEQHGVFSRDEARALGCSDGILHRLADKNEIERVLPRVYRFSSAPPTWSQRAKAGTLYAGENSWLSHRSSAYHLDMIDRCPGVIEITTTAVFRSRLGLRIRRVGDMPRSDTRTIKSIPVTNPHRTIVDFSTVLEHEALERVLDDCLFRRIVELGRIQARLDKLGGRGRPSTRGLRELLEVRGNQLAMPLTVLENKFLEVLRKGGIDEPENQVSVESDAHKTWRLDFAYPHHKVLIEVDGRRFHAARRRQKNDMRRDNVMNVRGWTVLRFTWEDVVTEPEYVLGLVRLALGLAPLV
ncbi:type IV toxin-antitoxin system AbiEi family antitoxin domain-containing protein [soil metagenome]